MAFVHAQFFSPTLGKQTALYAILPDSGDGPFPVYYLLHGLSDDYTIWHRRTRIEAYAAGKPIIVVMPDGFRSFYTDHGCGPAYGKYMAQDVVGFVERTFPAQRQRSGRCIGGLSMGGYGALRLALAYPELFCSANSHSGALQIWKEPLNNKPTQEYRCTFGENPVGSAHDLEALVKKAKRSRHGLPALRIDCGEADFLIEHNRTFHRFLEKSKVPHEYAEFPGAHSWDYWDLHVQEALAFHLKNLKLK